MAQRHLVPVALLTAILSCSAEVPHASGASAGIAATAAEICAPALAGLIRHSRDQALADGTRPLPPQLRKSLLPYFEEELLDDVRWTISSARPGVDTFLAGSLEYDGAVTLDNVIVFFNEEATRKARLWIHELDHVRQYRRLGIHGFARAYVSGWNEVELAARGRSVAISAHLAKKRNHRKTV